MLEEVGIAGKPDFRIGIVEMGAQQTMLRQQYVRCAAPLVDRTHQRNDRERPDRRNALNRPVDRALLSGAY
jgi:hypothetical protein